MDHVVHILGASLDSTFVVGWHTPVYEQPNLLWVLMYLFIPHEVTWSDDAHFCQ